MQRRMHVAGSPPGRVHDDSRDCCMHAQHYLGDSSKRRSQEYLQLAPDDPRKSLKSI